MPISTLRMIYLVIYLIVCGLIIFKHTKSKCDLNSQESKRMIILTIWYIVYISKCDTTGVIAVILGAISVIYAESALELGKRAQDVRKINTALALQGLAIAFEFAGIAYMIMSGFIIYSLVLAVMSLITIAVLIMLTIDSYKNRYNYLSYDNTSYQNIKSDSNGINADSTEQYTPTLNFDNIDFSRLFSTPNEKALAVLGAQYILDIMHKVGYITREIFLDKGLCIVSDKRIYFCGKTFKFVGPLPMRVNETKIINVYDFTGTSEKVKNPVWLIFITALIGVVELIGACASCYSSECIIALTVAFFLMTIGYVVLALVSSKIKYIIGTICIAIAYFCVYGCMVDEPSFSILKFAAVYTIVILIGTFIYGLLHRKWFTIEYNGGKISFQANEYTHQEIIDFQNQLIRIKDNMYEKMYTR